MKELIRQLELELLQPSVRSSTTRLGELIADDFVEFGSSGLVHSKQTVLESLPGETGKTFDIEDFEVRQLSEDVILAAYKIRINGVASLRSSIWKLNGTNWQMVFHQGTKLTTKAEDPDDRHN